MNKVILDVTLATHNQGKIKDWRYCIEKAGFVGIAFTPSGDLGLPEPDEPHRTFLENALHKAREASRACGGKPAVSEDSGICITALNGAPGVDTATYVPLTEWDRGVFNREEQRSLQMNYIVGQLLKEMEGVENREVMAHCTIVGVRFPEDPSPIVVSHRDAMQLATSPRGKEGFGVDCILQGPTGQTQAELPWHKRLDGGARERAIFDLILKINQEWR